MRRAIALIGLSGIVGAGLSLAVLPTSKTSECGKIVADAWCEAQGFAKATAFGIASREDFTGSVSKPVITEPAEQPLSITCGG